MGLFEYETKERMRREEAARRLHALADDLERHNEVTVRRDGVPFTVEVPDEVVFEFEVEVGAEESEIEVTLAW